MEPHDFTRTKLEGAESISTLPEYDFISISETWSANFSEYQAPGCDEYASHVCPTPITVLFMCLILLIRNSKLMGGNDEIDIYRQNLANNNSVSKFQEMLNIIEYYDENTDINEIVNL